jgi:hypothetical protein
MLRSILKLAAFGALAWVGYSVYKSYTGPKAYVPKGTLTDLRTFPDSSWNYVLPGGDTWKIVNKKDPTSPGYDFQGTSSASNQTKKFDVPMTISGRTQSELIQSIDGFYK